MITEYKLEDAGREMLITVKRSSRKTLGLEVRENGEIFARIPEKYQAVVQSGGRDRGELRTGSVRSLQEA